MEGLKHTKMADDLANPKKPTSSALSTGRCGRPSNSAGSSKNQADLQGWFKQAANRSEQGERHITHGMDSILSLLCWGYWGKLCNYAQKPYAMQGLLQDPTPGLHWIPEPYAIASVQYSGSTVNISGTFRHVDCKRVSTSGSPFTDLTCCNCARILQERDFKMRVIREDSSLEKRDNRNTGTGRRLGFLSVLKLATHSRVITKKYRIERAYHAHNRRRVSQLKMFRPLLKQLVGIGDPATDVLKFCTNIVAAYRTSAFGGKPALWNFMKDVATNLNRKKQGFRFSTNSKSFAQTLKIYGGRRMCDLFSLNFAGPTYMTIKRENQKGVQFVPGEHREVFRCVAEIYKCAMVVHGVVGPIPMILAEDETKVKPRVTWEQKWDALGGFCGPKDDHVCVSNYKVSIGDGEEGYNKIADAFRNDKIGGFTRVIMVSPMHEKLPRLILSVACTCNCFDADWVKKQWERVDALWAAECEQVVGPILGHASDGDSRRHQLMLLDYLTTTQNRYTVPWEGWLMCAGLDNEGRIYGLHDQDFIHNGKKLINPLDSPVRIL
jgi:hypothetical protein